MTIATRDVANLGLAGELGFLQVGHADDVHAPTAVEIRLGFGGELRAFHADVGAAAFADDAGLLAGRDHGFGKLRADGVGERDVRDDAFAEESVDALAGAIDELVGDDELQRLVFFLERADGRDRENALDAELFEAVNVGAEVQFGGQNAVAASVAGQEGDFACPRACPERTGRKARRRECRA